MGEQQNQLPSDVLRHGLPERNCLRVTGGVVHNNQYVLMVSSKLGKGTHQIHIHSLKDDTNNRQRHKQSRCWSFPGSALESEAALAILHLTVHPRPEESILNLLQGVLAC